MYFLLHYLERKSEGLEFLGLKIMLVGWNIAYKRMLHFAYSVTCSKMSAVLGETMRHLSIRVIEIGRSPRDWEITLEGIIAFIVNVRELVKIL